MNRTWTVYRPGYFKPGEIIDGTTVRAFDADEAAVLALPLLGFLITPCCELGDEPCADCAEAAYDRAQEAREQGYGPAPRRETPGELRSQDADRGRLPDR